MTLANAEPTTIEVLNPANGALLATLPALDAAALEALAQRARAAQPDWAAAGFDARAKVLGRMQRWLLDNSERVIETIVSETGKTHEDAELLELGYTVSALSFWAHPAGRVPFTGAPGGRLPGRAALLRAHGAGRRQTDGDALGAARPGRRDRAVELPPAELLRRRDPGPGGRQ